MRLLAQVLSLAFSITVLAALTLRAAPGCSTKEPGQPQAVPAAQAPPPAANPAPPPPTTNPPPPPKRFMPASKAGPIFVAPPDPLFPPAQNSPNPPSQNSPAQR